MESVYVGVRKVPGGFLLESQFGDSIETSLNKVIARVKEILSQEVTPFVPE